MSKRFSRPLALLGLSAALLLALCGCRGGEVPVTHSAPAFTLDILNTGKSDSMLLRMDGYTILCDTADADDYDAICALLEGYGIDKLDLLLLTHYDKDHIGSAARLLETYAVGTIVGPDYTESSQEYQAMELAAQEAAVAWNRLTSQQTWHYGLGSVSVEPPAKLRSDDNNNSLIITVSWEGVSLLLMGDALKARTEDFLPQALAYYDLVKLPHHGDTNKALEQLLADTSPAFAIETVAQSGNVDEGLTALLAEQGTQLLCTCDGSIHFSCENGTLAASQE